MTQTTKKKYSKPCVTSHGSVEQVTGWTGGGCGEFLGGSRGTGKAVACKVHGPQASFGS